MAFTRRQFLKNIGVLSLLIPLAPVAHAARVLQSGTPPESSREFNDWIWMGPDNQVVIGVSQCEVGQGIFTGLAEVVAAEMEADWENVSVQFVTGRDAYRHSGGGEKEVAQYVAASLSMTHFYDRMRQAGAQARAFFLAAGAQHFATTADHCYCEKSHVIYRPTGAKVSYGALIPWAEKIDLARLPVVLKTPEQEKSSLIGQPVKRIDSAIKVHGEAIFGIDVTVPNMLIAVPWMVPTLNGRIIAIKNESAIRSMSGVVDIVKTRHWSTLNMFKLDSDMSLNTILVVAESYWQAKKAADLLDVDYEITEKDHFSSQTIDSRNRELLLHGELVTAMRRGETEQLIDAQRNGDNFYEAFYTGPYITHATMEPYNATCYVEADKVTAWGPFQGQDLVRGILAKMAHLTPEAVTVHTTFLGGSFGRKFTPDSVMHAFFASKAVKRPVKVIYPREIDVQHGYYRPGNSSHYQAALDEDGYPVAMWAKHVGQGLFCQVHRNDRVKDNGGWDETMVECVYNNRYQIPNQRVDCGNIDQNISLTFLRGVGSTTSLFFMESFISELSYRAKKDDIAYRRHLLSNSPEMLRVIDATAKAAGWDTPPAKNRHRGLATNFWVARDHAFLSWVALITEVEVTGSQWRVVRMTCGVDCGKVINPNLVKAAIEGGLGFGLSGALYSQLTFDNGRVQQSNFHDFGVIQLQDMPEIEVVLLESDRPPQGAGEVSTAVVAPSVASAVLRATGQPVRHMPFLNKSHARTATG